jgi:hypothetical protein
MSRYTYTDAKRAHLHTLDGKPLIGTSTACKVIAKPLTWWAAGMAVEKFGWLNPKKHTSEAVQRALEEAFAKVTAMTLDAYAKLLTEAYRAHNTKKEDAAEAGTDMHAELEKYVKTCIETNGGIPLAHSVNETKQVSVFTEWSMANIERFLWSEAHCYSERLWVGGITDCGALMKDGKTAVIDFKSSKDAYFDQFVQAAGYALQVGEQGLFDADGNEVPTNFKCAFDVLYIVPFGSDDPTPRPHYDVEGRMADFEAACRLYKSSQLEEFNK